VRFRLLTDTQWAAVDVLGAEAGFVISGTRHAAEEERREGNGREDDPPRALLIWSRSD